MPDRDCFASSGDVSTSNRQKATGWPRWRIIWHCEEEKGPYLTRYYLCETKWFSLYLHKFHSSDDDRALHDHPWAFITFLLSSGYWEITPAGRFWRRQFSLLYRPATWTHRVEIVKPTWTLVLRFKWVREWGFFPGGKWMAWKDYSREHC